MQRLRNAASAMLPLEGADNPRIVQADERSTAMIIQYPDGTIIEAPIYQSPEKSQCGTYRVEVATDLLDELGSTIDWLIGFAFDTVGALHLDLRVLPADARSRATP